jgi:PAS domain S-box-containing protein
MCEGQSINRAAPGLVNTLNESPGLQLIYETAPIGLAFLSTDCRYLMINQHLTEICGISVADHIGRSVREMVPQVAEQVEHIVQTIVRTGEPIIGIEVNGQRPDRSNVERVWITYWHPLKNARSEVIGINVAAEEITERKRAETELAASREALRGLNEKLAQRVEAQAQDGPAEGTADPAPRESHPVQGWELSVAAVVRGAGPRPDLRGGPRHHRSQASPGATRGAAPTAC